MHFRWSSFYCCVFFSLQDVCGNRRTMWKRIYRAKLSRALTKIGNREKATTNSPSQKIFVRKETVFTSLLLLLICKRFYFFILPREGKRHQKESGYSTPFFGRRSTQPRHLPSTKKNRKPAKTKTTKTTKDCQSIFTMICFPPTVWIFLLGHAVFFPARMRVAHGKGGLELDKSCMVPGPRVPGFEKGHYFFV
jgi:hypothetical protein